jgi:lipopolysaccharide export system protein LptA
VIKPLLIFLALAVTVPAEPAYAQEEQVPMKVRSESMVFDQQKNTVVFTGDVHAVREDFDIRAREIVVQLAGSGKGKQAASGADMGEIEKIVAKGAVRIENQGRVGTSETAVYDVERGVLVMEGDPVLTEGENRISGKIVRIYLREDRSEVEGGDGKQVEALFFTPKEEME